MRYPILAAVVGLLMSATTSSVLAMSFMDEQLTIIANKNSAPIHLKNHDAMIHLMKHATAASVVKEEEEEVSESQSQHQRLLEGQGNNNEYNSYNSGKDYSFLSDYAVKFQGCWHKEVWDSSAQYANAPKVVTKRYVKFRLCPRDNCSDKKISGCSKDYGEYVTDLNSFVDAYMAESIQNEEYSSKFSNRAGITVCRKILKSCGCLARKWDDDWFDWDECYENCVSRNQVEYCDDYKNRLTPQQDQEEGQGYADDAGYVAADAYGDDGNYNVKANVYDDMYFEDDYYDDDNGENLDDEEAFLYRYSRCRLWSEAGQVVQYNIDDNAYGDDVEYVGNSYTDDTDESNQDYYPYLYIGPFCANKGSSVFMGMFTDRACSNYADKSGGRNTYYKMTGEQLPYSRTSMVQRNCVKCTNDMEDYSSYGDYGAYGENQYQETKEICTALYDSSGKCEKKLKADKESKVNNSCNFLSKVKVRGMFYFDLNDNATAQGFIWFFLSTTLLFGSYVGYLQWKMYSARKANPEAVYFYD